MLAEATVDARSTDPIKFPARSVRLMRAVVLLVVGLAITFSATMHEQLGFDLVIVVVALGAIGLTHLVESVASRGLARTPVALILAVVSLAAAVAVAFTNSVNGMAVVIAAWALVGALLEFIGGLVRPGARPDTTLLGALGLLLAILVLLVRDDQVAVVGFVGAYAIIAGVFLGISAFDSRRPTGSTASDQTLQH